MSRGGKRVGAGRPAGSISAAPRIRQAFLTALDELEAEGTPLSALLKAQLKDAPISTLKALAAFEPRESIIDANVQSDPFTALLREVEAHVRAAGV